MVLTRDEVKAVLAQLDGDAWSMASLMFGAGLRLMGCLHLRVLDVGFARSEIVVRDGEGGRDRVMMLPFSLMPAPDVQLAAARAAHQCDLAEGWGRVELPRALARTYPNAPADRCRQWVFPQRHRWTNLQTGEQGRHHVHETLVQRAVKDAVRRAGVARHATCHTLRHPFATRLLEAGYEIRTIRELLGHEDISTAMIYAYVLSHGGQSVRSPIDGL